MTTVVSRPVSAHRVLTCLAVAATLALGGCATAPPSHVATTPAVAAPSQWAETSPGEGAVGDMWWRDFGDPVLDRLVDSALDANRDLKVAAAPRARARSATAPRRSAVRGWMRWHAASAGAKTASIRVRSAAASACVPRGKSICSGAVHCWWTPHGPTTMSLARRSARPASRWPRTSVPPTSNCARWSGAPRSSAKRSRLRKGRRPWRRANSPQAR